VHSFTQRVSRQEREYARIALEESLCPNLDLAWHHSQRALDAITEADRSYKAQLADALLPTRSSDADRERLIQACVELASMKKSAEVKALGINELWSTREVEQVQAVEVADGEGEAPPWAGEGAGTPLWDGGTDPWGESPFVMEGSWSPEGHALAGLVRAVLLGGAAGPNMVSQRLNEGKWTEVRR
jgi:hypothetical protein